MKKTVNTPRLTGNRRPNENSIKRNILDCIKSVDVLFFAFFLLTTLLIILAREQSPKDFLNLLSVRATILFWIAIIVYLNGIRKHPALNFIRNTYPILLSGYFYSETVHYNKLFFRNIDPWLENVEVLFFGMQPSIEFSLHFSNRLFSELMYFGYFSFYVLILGFTLFVSFREKRFFHKAVFLLSSSLYIFYFLFGLIPSAGPQFYFSSPDNILPNAYFFDKIMHFIQRTAEQPTGAFPSSHVGISLIILMMSRKKAPIFFKVALPLTVLLVLSTVYIKAHYVIDVLGAIIVAPFILYLSRFLYSLFSKRT